MSLTRWQAIVLAAAIVIVPILSCSQRSLVLVTVNAPQGVTGYSNVLLVVTAVGQETTMFDKVSFTDGAYKVGVYLPSDMSGPVSFSAEVVQDGCQIATGGPVASPAVSAGATVSMAIDLTAITGPCLPVDGGAGSSGTGGGRGSGGSGTGGVATGAGGAVGSGGVVGSGGAIGTGGVTTGSGGVVGSGGAMGTGGSGKGGTVGSGGVMGSGGVIGTGGMVGSGGIVGSGGGGGKGGGATGGVMGSGGVIGSGGTSGCTCPDPNEICQPGTTTCICSQSDSTACAGATCGTVTNICNQTVSCGVCPTGYVCDSTLNACRKLVVTGCGGSIVATGTGLVAGTTEAAVICPAN